VTGEVDKLEERFKEQAARTDATINRLTVAVTDLARSQSELPMAIADALRPHLNGNGKPKESNALLLALIVTMMVAITSPMYLMMSAATDNIRTMGKRVEALRSTDTELIAANAAASESLREIETQFDSVDSILETQQENQTIDNVRELEDARMLAEYGIRLDQLESK